MVSASGHKKVLRVRASCTIPTLPMGLCGQGNEWDFVTQLKVSSIHEVIGELKLLLKLI